MICDYVKYYFESSYFLFGIFFVTSSQKPSFKINFPDLICLAKKEALDYFNFKEGKLTILITGGSQGAHRLNTACFEALSVYPKKLNLQVIHICGLQDLTWLAEGYARTTLIYKLFNFFTVMQYAYSAADLIISRAGATTIAELGKFKIPAILIPYPFAYAHQLVNAQVLEDIGAAEIILDDHLSVNRIIERLQEYSFNNERLKKMQLAYQKLPAWDATKILTSEVISLK